MRSAKVVFDKKTHSYLIAIAGVVAYMNYILFFSIRIKLT